MLELLAKLCILVKHWSKNTIESFKAANRNILISWLSHYIWFSQYTWNPRAQIHNTI